MVGLRTITNTTTTTTTSRAFAHVVWFRLRWARETPINWGSRGGRTPRHFQAPKRLKNEGAGRPRFPARSDFWPGWPINRYLLRALSGRRHRRQATASAGRQEHSAFAGLIDRLVAHPGGGIAIEADIGKAAIAAFDRRSMRPTHRRFRCSSSLPPPLRLDHLLQRHAVSRRCPHPW